MEGSDSRLEVSRLLFNMMSIYVFSCRSNDIDAATSAKFKVEQKQREEAKVRKDDNSSFNNKVSIKKYNLVVKKFHN